MKEKSIPKCDLLEVYSHVDKERLKSTPGNVNWDILTANDVTNLDKINGVQPTEENIHFATRSEEDYLKTMELAMKAPNETIGLASTFSDNSIVDRVYVDDI